MTKRSADANCKREFNEQWENEFLFILTPSGKPFCIVCESTLSYNRRYDLNRHYKAQHQTNIEIKLKLIPGSVLRKEYVAKKKEEIIRRQNIFAKVNYDDLELIEISYEIALLLARKKKPFCDGEEIVKPCLQIFARHLGIKTIEKKAHTIALSRPTITRRIEELSEDLSQQLEELVQSCTFFSISMDDSTDICDVAQLSIFIRGIDDNFNVFEELAGLESLHGKTRGSDIFEKLKSCLENLKIDFGKLISVCTDGAPSMTGKVNGATTLLENFLNRPIQKYHCIIHQEVLCAKTINMQHIMSPVVKCVNKIRAKALNRREFREYCEMLDMEYGELVLHCEVRWLSRGQVLSRFWKLKSAVYNFLEQENELPNERSLLIDNNWLFDLAFLVDITSHLNDLNSRLQGKNKLFPNLFNNINSFKMKLNLFIAQLEKQNFSQFPHLKEQCEYAPYKINLIKYIDKIKLLQESFGDRFKDLAKEENYIQAFTHPFSLNEQNLMEMPSNMQMEFIDLKTNLLLKSKFDDISSDQNASDIINFWRSLPSEHFPELRKFAKNYICRFGTTYICEQAFSSMTMIKNKTRSRITDSNLKNSLVLSISNLTPNIERLSKTKQG